MPPKRIATIDLGTNSIHLLIIEKTNDDSLSVLFDQSHVVRLGQDLRKTGNIQQVAIDRTIASLEAFQQVLTKFQCRKVFMTATSAMREARNQQDVVLQLEQAFGFQIEIIEKETEARLSYQSVLSEENTDKTCAVVDIGGGSTEIAWGNGTDFSKGQSVKIGTVKLLEGPLSASSIQDLDITQAKNEIMQHFKQYNVPQNIDLHFATAGTFTQLAALELQLETYDPQKIDRFKLTKEAIATWISKLKPLSLSDKKAIKGMHPQRADVALSGAVLAYCLCEKLETDHFLIRDRGVRFGRAIDALGPFKGPIKCMEAKLQS